MPKTSEIQAPYFQHDYAAQADKKIKKLIFVMGFEGYGLFWSIVELLHHDELKVGEEYLVCGEQYSEKVKRVLTEFELFRIADGYYVSDRVIANIERQEESAAKNRQAANTRWLLSVYCKKYKEEFGVSLNLSKEEKAKIIEFEKEIPDFKDKLTDIFYTAHKMPPFDNGVIADSSWLLKKNNLRELLNGHYGKLKHKLEKETKEEIQPDKIGEEIKKIKDKNSAVEYLILHNIADSPFIAPPFKSLMKKFNILPSDLANSPPEVKDG